MDDQSAGGARRAAAESTCFIGSILDGPGDGLIVLRGDLGAAAVGRLGEHIDAFLAGPTRYLVIDARAVERYHPDLLDLLGHTQRRLEDRRGMLQARGLHPTRLADPVPDGPSAPVGAGTTAPDSGEHRGRHRGDVRSSSGRHTRSPDPDDAAGGCEPDAHARDGAPA